MTGEKFHVYLERKIGGYCLLSTSRGIEWGKRTATKHARDVNQWIDEGRGHWARNYRSAEVRSIYGN